MSNLRTTLDHLASVFASSVLDAIRGASLQEILAESGGSAGSAGGGRRGGRSRLEASVLTEGSHAGAPSSPAGARRRRGRLARRSAGDISQIVDSIVSLLERRPDGLRAEQIRAELGLEAKELPRPIAEALAGKRINKQGQKRATTYYARGASPRAAGKSAAAGGASTGTGRGRAKKSAATAAGNGNAGGKKARGAAKRAGKTAKKAGRKGGRGSSSDASASSSAESA